jgi:hypothetical protein
VIDKYGRGSINWLVYLWFVLFCFGLVFFFFFFLFFPFLLAGHQGGLAELAVVVSCGGSSSEWVNAVDSIGIVWW